MTERNDSSDSVTQRARQIRKSSEEATDAVMRRIEETGELRHLYGRPLNLDDDPNWLATKVLKQAGFSHPLIERSQEIDEPRMAVERLAERLRKRRARIERSDSKATPHDIHGFNEWRRHALNEYREKLVALNRAIRDFNLQAPDVLQQIPVMVEDAVECLSKQVPPLDLPCPSRTDTPRRFLWKRTRAEN